MIFITYLWRSLTKKWVTIIINKTFISLFLFTKYKYSPFKKSLFTVHYTVTVENLQCALFDEFNKTQLYKNYNNIKVNELWFNLQLFLIPYWKRIVFKGKGFRMRKFKNSRKLTFNFGHSHWTKLRLRVYYIMFTRKRRQSQYFFCYYWLLFKQICQLISNLRRINKYTKRGLRLKKQPIIRRFGKISQMISAHNY